MARLRAFGPAALLFAALAAAPFVGFGSGHALTLLARGMVLAQGAVALALLVGGAGLPSMGHAALLGIGAYAVVVLDAAGVTDLAFVLPAAIAAAALFALLTGAVALRTAGVNFIMITLAFGQMAHFATASLASYGGDDGYTLYGRSTVAGRAWLADPLAFHFICLAVLVVAWALCGAVLASRTGRVLRAAAESPLRVQAVGLSPYPYRLLAMVLAGAIGGVSGVLLANATEFVAPSYLTWQRSGELLFMVILGGSASLTGAAFGALLYVGLEEALSHWTPHWRLGFGVLLVVAAIHARGGIAGALAAVRWRRAPTPAAVAERRAA